MKWQDALTDSADGCRIAIALQPGASQTGFLGYDPWRKRIRVAVTAPPREGAANMALIMFLQASCGLTGRALSLASGQSDGRKVVVAKGFTKAQVVAKLETFL